VQERIQKLLATTGIGSRRQIEQWIAEGRVEVNGKLAVTGQKISGHEVVVVDGKRVPLQAPGTRVVACLMYHKPVGEVCTRDDPEGRPTIFDKLPPPLSGRWISVGRLDVMTSGLLLLTTDGELAHHLMHPSSSISREYAVRIQGEPDDDVLERLRRGVDLEDGPARFHALDSGRGEGSNRWYRVTVREGRNRLVRRLFEAVGFPVNRLIRTRFGELQLPRELRPGRCREIRHQELRQLYRSAGLGEPGEARRTAVPPRPAAPPRA